MSNPITISATVSAPVEKVWECWSQPKHITQWAFASDTWEAPHAENDLRIGGKFKTTMAAKDKSSQFDFGAPIPQLKKITLLPTTLATADRLKFNLLKCLRQLKLFRHLIQKPKMPSKCKAPAGRQFSIILKRIVKMPMKSKQTDYTFEEF